MISVIIPIYNGEEYINDTIENILKTKEDIELLLVNDGSTDNSRKICYEWAEKDKRIKYFEKDNGGIADAREYGLEKATGEYICFCDQDDYINETFYSTMLENINKYNVDLVISNPGSIVDGKKKNSKSIYHSTVETDIEKLLMEVVSKGAFVNKNENGIVWPSIWNCIFKKKIIEYNNISFHSFVDYEDDELFLLNYLIYCDSVYLEEKNLYFWNEHDESRSHTTIYINNYERKIKDLWSFRKQILNKRLTEYHMNCIESYMNYSIMINLFLNEANDNRLIKNIKTIKNYKKSYCTNDIVKDIKRKNILNHVGVEYKKIYNDIIKNATIAVLKYKAWKVKERIKRK